MPRGLIIGFSFARDLTPQVTRLAQDINNTAEMAADFKIIKATPSSQIINQVNDATKKSYGDIYIIGLDPDGTRAISAITLKSLIQVIASCGQFNPGVRLWLLYNNKNEALNNGENEISKKSTIGSQLLSAALAQGDVFRFPTIIEIPNWTGEFGFYQGNFSGTHTPQVSEEMLQEARNSLITAAWSLRRSRTWMNVFYLWPSQMPQEVKGMLTSVAHLLLTYLSLARQLPTADDEWAILRTAGILHEMGQLIGWPISRAGARISNIWAPLPFINDNRDGHYAGNAVDLIQELDKFGADFITTNPVLAQDLKDYLTAPKDYFDGLYDFGNLEA